MNKLLTKIVGLSLGLSMAIGVGVAASYSGKDAVSVNAVDQTIQLNNIGSNIGSTANTEVLTTTIGTTTLNYLQCKKQGSSMLMTKSVGAFISNHSEIGGTIKSVELSINSGASGKTTYDVAFGTSEYLTATAGIGAVNITGGNSHVFENYSSGSYVVPNATYFCVTLGNANNGQVLNINIVYDDGQAAQSHTISFAHGEGSGSMTSASSNTGTYTFPSTSSFTAPTNKILKGWRVGSTDYKLGDTYTFATTTENITATALWIKDASTESNAYTVAEAKDAIDFNVGLSNIYVSGIVSEVVSVDVGYKNATYWISDDGESNELEAFRGRYLNNTDFTSEDQIQADDIVTIHGSLTLYQSTTYELTQGNYLTSLVRPSKEVTSVTISGTLDKDQYYTNEPSWSPVGLTVTAHYSDETSEDVTNLGVTWSYSPLTPADMGASASAQTLTITATYQSVPGSTTRSVYVSTPTVTQYSLYDETITAGEYVILNTDNANAVGDQIVSNRVANVTAPVVTSGSLSTDNTSIKFNIAASGEYYTIQNLNNGKYLAATTSKNQAAYVDTVDDHAKWTFTYSANGWTIENLGRASDADTPANKYLRNNGDSGWAAYGTTTGKMPLLYKKVQSATNPMTADPILSTGSTAVAHIGQDLIINVTTTPVDTDETLLVRSTDTSETYLTVTGSGKTFVARGVSLTSSPVTVTIYGSEGVYSASVQITVENPVKTVNDKVLTADGLGLSNSYVDKDEPGTYLFDGANFSVFYLCKTKGIQFHKADGYITNAEALSNQTTSYIKAITLIMHSDNAGTPAVYEGSATNPSTSVAVSGTFDATGINTYVFSSSMSYFKVGCDSATTNAVNIDNIIIELADSTSTALGNARTAAQKILTGLNGLCGESGSGLVTQAQWEAIATSVGTLDNDTKAILKGAVRVAINDLALGSATIENAMYHYDAVLAKFRYTDILEIGSSAAHTNTSPMVINSETAVVIITVIAAISITSIGALLVLKKRKEQF